jgi:AcrR family transcriptional regulator
MVSKTNNSTETKWVRARRPEQVAQRRRAILEAAAELFTEREYSEVSLNEIARRASFTKSNVYRYFATREEIFLALFLEEYGSWVDGLAKALGRLAADSDSAAISRAVIREMVKHERLLNLASLLAVSLERNSSHDAVLAFKLSLAAANDLLMPAYARLLPGTSGEDLGYLHAGFHALAAGLWPLCNPNETARKVLSRPELSHFLLEFSPLMERVLSAMIEDIRRQ